eukprot:1472652-Pleurochrysis_carterae.AAC.1
MGRGMAIPCGTSILVAYMAGTRRDVCRERCVRATHVRMRRRGADGGLRGSIASTSTISCELGAAIVLVFLELLDGSCRSGHLVRGRRDVSLSCSE